MPASSLRNTCPAEPVETCAPRRFQRQFTDALLVEHRCDTGGGGHSRASAVRVCVCREFRGERRELGASDQPKTDDACGHTAKNGASICSQKWRGKGGLTLSCTVVTTDPALARRKVPGSISRCSSRPSRSEAEAGRANARAKRWESTMPRKGGWGGGCCRRRHERDPPSLQTPPPASSSRARPHYPSLWRSRQRPWIRAPRPRPGSWTAHRSFGPPVPAAPARRRSARVEPV